jgi:hypothetical protein
LRSDGRTPVAHARTGWLKAADALAGVLLLVAVWILLTGGTRYLIFDTVISLRSPMLFTYAAGAVLVLRHILAPRPSVFHFIRSMDAAIAARPAFAAALRPFLASRIGVLVVALFAVLTFGYPGGAGDMKISNNPLVNLPARWDAGWYATIALDGYSWGKTFSRQQDIAFFPALPVLSRAVATVFGVSAANVSRESRGARVLWSAVLISLISFLWGLYYLVRLGEDLIGPERAVSAALLLAAYPFSLFYNAPYTEGLFLVGAVGACFHFRRGEWVAASGWGLLAGLTRPNGCFLSIVLAYLAWEQVRVIMSQPGTLAWWKPAAVRLAVAAMPGIGMLIFTAYLYQMTGVWFAWARSHGAWGRTFEGLTPLASAFERLSSEPFMDVIASDPYSALNSLGLLFACVLLWPTLRRLGTGWALFVVINVLSPLLAGGVLSMGRLTSTLFPLFLALAAVLPSRAVAPCTVTFAVLQGFCAALFFTWRALY